MTIKLTFDPGLASLPEDATIAAQAAADFWNRALADTAVVNIDVGYLFADGHIADSSAVATTFVSSTDVSGSAVRAALTADATSAADAASLDSHAYPATIAMATAQQKALGLLGASTAVDATVVLGDVPFDYDPNAAPAAGQYSLFTTLIHEFAHALGRLSNIQSPAESPTLLDLMRYAVATRQRATSFIDSFFSIDGGATSLAAFNLNPGGTASDWSAREAHDVFDAFGAPGVAYRVTPVDILEMDVLGYDVSTATTLSAADETDLTIAAMLFSRNGALGGNGAALGLSLTNAVAIDANFAAFDLAPGVVLTVSGAALTGSGGIDVESGSLELASDNSFAGGAVIGAASLRLDVAQAAGSGPIVFKAGATGTLRLAAPVANAIGGFDVGDRIDLDFLAYDPTDVAIVRIVDGQARLDVDDATGMTLASFAIEAAAPFAMTVRPTLVRNGATARILGANADEADFSREAGGAFVDLEAGYALVADAGKGFRDGAAGVALARTEAVSASAVDGTDFDDRLYGAAAPSTFRPGLGRDVVYGRSGADVVDYSNLRAGVYVDLGARFALKETAAGVGWSDVVAAETAAGAGFQDDAVIGVANVRGTAFDDRFYGALGGAVIMPGAGADVVYGAGDAVDYSNLAGGVFVDLAARFSYKATADGAGWTNAATTAAGGFTQDALYGVSALVGTGFADRLYGRAGAALSGGAGDDVLYSAGGANILDGGDGDDRLVASGADTMTGGAGQDLFIIPSAAKAADTITDFATGVDSLFLASGAFGYTTDARVKLISGAGSVGDLQAGGAARAFVYRTDTGQLFFDDDGAGPAGPTLVATLTGAPALAASDIVIY